MNSKLNNQNRHLLYTFLLVLACIVVYLNSLPNEFVIDDKLIIPQNPIISNLGYLPKIFMTSYAVSYPTTYYRPLFSATLQLEYQIWKLHPWGYRLINILLHILVTLMVFRLGLRLLPNTLSAFFAGLLYAVHPVHVESVAWISGRADVLACLGLLLSFYFYLKYRCDEWHSPILFIGSLCCYLLGLLGKEMAITLPFLILFYDFTFPPKKEENYPPNKCIAAYFGYFLILVNYLLIRKYAIGSTFGTNFTQTSLWVRLLTILGVWMDYFRLLLFPTNLSADYITLPVTQLFDMRVIFPLLILIAIIYLFVKQRKSNPLIFFFGFWIFITLLPVSNILPIRDSLRIEAERFLYIPSVGFCLLIPVIAENLGMKFRIQNRKSIVFIVLIFVLYSTRTVVRNLDWRNDHIFYTKMTRDSPLSSRGWMELGNVEFRKGNSTGAISYYEQALSCESTESSIYSNLGNAYALQNDYDKASDYLIQAHDLSPADPKIISNLAYMQLQLKNYNTAILLLDKIIPLTPQNYFNYDLLGQAYEKKEMYPEALSAYQTSLSINSTYSDGWKRLGDLYTKLKQTELAKKAYSHVK